MNYPDRWKDGIRRGAERAEREYGHLSRDEIRALAERGKISPYVAQYLIARKVQP